jgi:hypothetical protein
MGGPTDEHILLLGEIKGELKGLSKAVADTQTAQIKGFTDVKERIDRVYDRHDKRIKPLEAFVAKKKMVARITSSTCAGLATIVTFSHDFRDFLSKIWDSMK